MYYNKWYNRGVNNKEDTKYGKNIYTKNEVYQIKAIKGETQIIAQGNGFKETKDKLIRNIIENEYNLKLDDSIRVGINVMGMRANGILDLDQYLNLQNSIFDLLSKDFTNIKNRKSKLKFIGYELEVSKKNIDDVIELKPITKNELARMGYYLED